jgi:hypothetical protein
MQQFCTRIEPTAVSTLGGDDFDLASYLRIEERELEAGGRN